MKESQVEKKYNDILNNKINRYLGQITTMGSDLYNLGKRFFGKRFKGVYPSDKIPELGNIEKYAIVNLDKSDQPGSHWIALAHYKGNIVIYDSFGRKHKKIIPSLSNITKKILETDNDAEQSLHEDNCGQRCLAWLIIFDTYGFKHAMMI